MKPIKKYLPKRIIILLIISIIILLITIIFFFSKKKVNIDFSFNGEETIELDLNEEYQELGYTLIVNGTKIENIKIENNIDNIKIGEYQVNYTYIDANRQKHIWTRFVKIIDRIPPEIILEGNSTINLLLNEKYEEPGYKIEDNYDKDIDWDSLIQITNAVDTSKVGTYTIKYQVKDLSGNENEAIRTIIVNKPKKVVTYTETKSQEKTSNKSQLLDDQINTVLSNKFTANGIYLEGYVHNSNGSYHINIVNDNNNYDYEMTAVNTNEHKGNLNLSEVSDGKYQVFITSSNKENLINKLATIEKIYRAKINDKLVTIEYSATGTAITIEPFSYQYDILIDPGHGGTDVGASNSYVYEKDLNLIVSKYEKCRYEEHGLTVFMIRDGDTYGITMGETTWKRLTQRAYAIGFYGAVSKIVYSNHHNSNSSSYVGGYEILTPAQYEEITTELAIANKLQAIYPLQENHKRVYARDYDSGTMYTTQNSEKYNFVDYYAIIRVPYQLFNTKVVIYEGSYLSNYNDFSWYWNNANWKQVSEIKIEEYVKELGKTYSTDTNCQ